MKITSVRHVSAPLASKIANAFISFETMTTNVVAVETDAVRDGEKVIGYGFSSNGRYAQPGILAERFIPRLMGADPKSLLDETGENLDPQAVWNTLMSNEKPGGHGERSSAIGALDMAIWDIHAKLAGKPLWKILSERYNGGNFDEKILVYPGGGYYYPGKGLEKLQEEMRGYREIGYKICKMKVGAVPLAEDMTRIEAAIEALGAGENLAVDVNGRFNLEQAIEFGKAIAPLGLAWYEEPGDPLDYHLNAQLIQHYDGPIATGENLFSHQDMTNLLRFGGMRPGSSYHAKLAGKPLWKILSDRYNGGNFDEKILVYPGGGYYYPGKGLEKLQEEMRGYREIGYKICKMKVGAVPLAEDMTRIEAAIEALGAGENLAVDVNGRFNLEQAIEFGKAIAPLGLAWYEEPGDPLDYHLNAQLIQHYDGPIATGENLFSHQDMTNLLRFGGMRPGTDWVQPDPSLAYGLTEYLVILETAEKLGWPRRRFLPHGGHQLALNMAAGLQLGGSESYPGVFAPYGGFADGIPIVGGYVTLPQDQPGIGMELKPKMIDEMRRVLDLG